MLSVLQFSVSSLGRNSAEGGRVLPKLRPDRGSCLEGGLGGGPLAGTPNLGLGGSGGGGVPKLPKLFELIEELITVLTLFRFVEALKSPMF